MRIIDADALKKAVNGRSTHWLNDWSTLGVLAVIDEQPTIDAVPVAHGEWIYTDKGWQIGKYKCSECEDLTNWRSPYCPNCGAKMKRKQEETK